jgi:acyl-CoA synthetase (AMP-forming)/AMP-acid ligase II
MRLAIQTQFVLNVIPRSIFPHRYLFLYYAAFPERCRAPRDKEINIFAGSRDFAQISIDSLGMSDRPLKQTRTLTQAILDLESVSSKGFHFLKEESDGSITETCTTFGDLFTEIVRRAAGLQAAGFCKGDRLVIIVPETQNFIATFLGAVLAGMIPVPVFPPVGMVQLNRYAATIASIVHRSEARAVVTTVPFDATVLNGSGTALRVLTPEQLPAGVGSFRGEKIRHDDLAFLQFTSGSTSHPKGVCVSHANIASNTDSIRTAFDLRTDDVPVSWLPLYHDMGLIGFLLTPIYARVATRFMPTQLFLRRPGTWLRTMSRHRGTISVAPNFAFALVARRLKDEEIGKLDLSSWRIAGCGAEPIRADDLRHFAEKLRPAGFRPESLLPMYGLAEATLAVTIPPLNRGLRWHGVNALKLRAQLEAERAEGPESLRIVACGPALPANEVRIFALDDHRSSQPLPDEVVGEIRVRGSNVTSGYWNDPAASDAAFAGEYLRTGDLGFFSNGDLHVCGRLKELIIVNGRKYFPDDIERAALTVTGVRTAMAFQVSHAAPRENGSSGVIVAVESAAPGRVSLDLLHRAIGTEVGLRVDDVVLALPGALPKTSSGKPRRREACRLYEAGELGGAPSCHAGDTNIGPISREQEINHV